MIEATIGTVLLLLAAVGTIQLVLVFHGALAGHGAAARAARTFAITREPALARRTLDEQMGTALRSLQWTVADPPCQIVNKQAYNLDAAAECTVTVRVPAILPGAGLFTGSGSIGTVTITETGWYPYGSQGN